MSEITDKNLTEIANLLKTKQVSAQETVHACLDRIQKTEEQIKALLFLNKENTLEQAQKMDEKGPQKDLPLWGVPLTLKDTLVTKDINTTCASKMLENFVPCYDSEIVRRLKQAGAIILGKTNMDEFAMGSTTETSYRAITSNPWDLSRVPGGSSGGSAASVAACQAFGSIGTDTNGSIRQPAAFCGIVGLKPTYGRVSRYGLISYAPSFDQAGTITRSVADAALLLKIIAGHDKKDSTSVPHTVPNYSELLNQRQDLQGLTIGIPTEYWQQLQGEVQAVLQDMLEKIKNLGGKIVEISLPHTEYAVATYYILSSAEASSNMAMFDGIRYGFRDSEANELHELYTGSRSKGLGQEVKRRIILGTYALSTGCYDAYYKKAAQVRRLILQDFEQAFQTCDLLYAPVYPTVAPQKNSQAKNPLINYMTDIFSVTLNLAGLPGLSLPAGLGKETKMPVGMQLIGKSFDEKLLLQVGHIIEKNHPWQMPVL